MLRSTGFFRGLDCPFYTGGGDGESGCNRPYCHFRHSSSRQRASSGVYEIGKAKDGPLDSNNQGYDPFKPEVVRPVEKYNAEPPASPVMDPGATELELVNRAIEAVQSEMEKEKKRLSRIGEQGYDPANSSIKAGYSRQAVAAVSSHSAYDPGSYQMSQSSEYNPTPRSSKYTLDSENNNSSSYANSMEYVPTAVSRVAAKKAAPAPMSRIPTTCSSSSKNKYTLDNLKPPTDMEYDPMSNFSAKPGAKGVKAVGTEGDGRKRVHPRWQKQSTDEEYVPVAKKPRQVTVEAPQKYIANYESDEESSGNEYRPTPKSRLQRRKSSADSADNEKRKSRETGACRQPPAQEFTIDGDEDEGSDSFEPLDSDQPDDEPPDKKWTKNSIQAKKVPSEKTVRKELTESVKKSSTHKEKKGSSGTEKTSKRPSQESGKKEKSHGKVVEEKGKIKDSEKGGKGLKLKDGKSKKPDKKKGEQSHGDKERNIGEAKKPKVDKVHQNVKESSKYKEQKNGRIEGGGREKDKKKSSSSTTTTSSSSKDKHKKSSSSLEKKDAKATKAKPRSLSHADLFGVESPEEEDEEDEDDERIVRKSASAFKRRTLVNKRKASDATETSSDDDLGPGDEGEHEDGHGDDGDAADFPLLQEDVDYDSDPMEECLRIFNESGYVKTEDKGRQAKQPPKEKEEDQDAQSTLTTLFPGQKKRVSHFKAKGSTEPSPNVLPKPQRRLTAQEVCYQRMQFAQQQAAELAASGAKNASPASRPLSSAAASGEKRRVMHRPNPALVAAKKPVLSESQQASRGLLSPSRAVPDQSSVRAHTSATMLSKTVSTSAQKRVAHTPTLKSSSMKRPIIPTEFGAKVPTNVRQRYLSVFIDECLKFCPSEEASFQMALDEEKLVYDRSSSKNIYLNVAVNALKKLRSKSTMPSAPSPPAASPSTGKSAVSVRRKSQSHEGVLGGRLAATTSYTINRTGKQQDLQLKGAVLYWKLKAYVLSEEQLQEHGYPRPHPEHLGHAVIYNAPEKKNQDPFAKVCCRCGADYKVNASGSCVRKEECNHHWGRLRRYKVSGGWETQYSCCSGAVGSPGCQVAKQHVQDNRKESLDGYVKTFSKPSSSDGNAGVYALDCEMCYTKQGLELTRVTVINSDLKVVYDTFVKPESKVVDYNTRFSGVTEEDLESATMRLRDVQAVLLNMFSADSILIGHSLESDLFALKLLHSTVVDTAVVFPHRLGLPYKRALRNVMADHLKRIIQDNAEGHDSSEDAAACMELMIWKIKEDAKVKR